MSKPPSVERIAVVMRRLDDAHGWIGEGSDIVHDLLAWITEGDAGVEEWALSLCEECGKRGPFPPGRHLDWCPRKEGV